MSDTTTNTKKKPNTLRLYADIKAEFTRLNNIKKNGVRLYSQEYIVSCIAEKFYRSPATVQNILYGRV